MLIPMPTFHVSLLNLLKILITFYISSLNMKSILIPGRMQDGILKEPELQAMRKAEQDFMTGSG
jgi:hypothetical protein